MKREDILREIENWENPTFLEGVQAELNSYSQKIDSILYERYMKQISAIDDEKMKARALKRLSQRNLIDENNQPITRNEDVKLDSEVPVINGAYDSATNKIVFNPKGAKSYYQSFLQFEEGKREGIRDFDYSKDISELEDLTPSEILYWCYCNDVNYTDFCKITLLHEDVHKWTLRGATGFGAVMMSNAEIVFLEGLVEQEARSVAKENPEIMYANCFRNDEVNLISFLSQYYEPSNALLYQSAGKFEDRSIEYFLRQSGVSEEQIDDEFDKVLDSIEAICYEKYSGKPNDEFEKSFYEIFLEKQEFGTEEILKVLRAYMDKDKITNMSSQIAQASKKETIATSEVSNAKQITEKMLDNQKTTGENIID